MEDKGKHKEERELDEGGELDVEDKGDKEEVKDAEEKDSD